MLPAHADQVDAIDAAVVCLAGDGDDIPHLRRARLGDPGPGRGCPRRAHPDIARRRLIWPFSVPSGKEHGFRLGETTKVRRRVPADAC